ncbi:MAG: hypothetical protein JO244_00445 [Solirubrobacterales bacterium]|nr:hypothetical protein [Solirubrobacterales bacterium]
MAHTVDRTDTLVEPGIEFYPGDPVRLRVVHREQRTLVTDDGAAIHKAGWPPHWEKIAQRLSRELDVNISRHGVVSLPVVRAGAPEDKVVRRIGEASLALYQELLELTA